MQTPEADPWYMGFQAQWRWAGVEGERGELRAEGQEEKGGSERNSGVEMQKDRRQRRPPQTPKEAWRGQESQHRSRRALGRVPR